jgi:hypothetical protein
MATADDDDIKGVRIAHVSISGPFIYKLLGQRIVLKHKEKGKGSKQLEYFGPRQRGRCASGPGCFGAGEPPDSSACLFSRHVRIFGLYSFRPERACFSRRSLLNCPMAWMSSVSVAEQSAVPEVQMAAAWVPVRAFVKVIWKEIRQRAQRA